MWETKNELWQLTVVPEKMFHTQSLEPVNILLKMVKQTAGIFIKYIQILITKNYLND